MAAETEIIATLPPMHPGEMLREEFLKPLGLSPGRVARACGIPRTRIERIAAEKIGVTGDSALRLARFFGTSPEFWMNLQSRYEIETARLNAADEIAAIRQLEQAA
ncbi:HigA family addiction module antitoxin [Bosea sp. CCNWLW174]|uniref:Addiction module antidote protein, HigA family n=1 Tax=Bosea lupini TaxID=1036779 RepID=A0A1H7X039_9HYPH|nr:HigA family addiction module antitoxin [Bosea lupini]SEM26489.1 addiction module antidote protein, HigA family [Bosea lupini]